MIHDNVMREIVPAKFCNPPKKSLVGLKFGRLTVLRFYGRRNRNAYYECVCDCGKQIIAFGFSMTYGETKSCGCYNADAARENRVADISGRRFGRLVAISLSHTKNNYTYWNVVCDCGTHKTVPYIHLVKDKTRSCGCLKREILSDRRGEKCHLWRGGNRSEYPREWNRSLKEQIRNRDNRTCMYPSCSYTDALGENSLLDVHHIDGDKQNCQPRNLISLCHNHHMKVESSNDTYWEEYFYSITQDYE